MLQLGKKEIYLDWSSAEIDPESEKNQVFSSRGRVGGREESGKRKPETLTLGTSVTCAFLPRGRVDTEQSLLRYKSRSQGLHLERTLNNYKVPDWCGCHLTSIPFCLGSLPNQSSY